MRDGLLGTRATPSFRAVRSSPRDGTAHASSPPPPRTQAQCCTATVLGGLGVGRAGVHRFRVARGNVRLAATAAMIGVEAYTTGRP